MKKRSLHWKEIITTLFFFLSIHFAAMAQNVTVQGTVVDTKGEPLPGVSIILEGTTQGTITNFDGQYTIEVPSDAQLIFQFIGFNNKTVAVNGQTKIDVTLAEDVVGLDEVVVVGYGTQKKSDVTGAIASMDDESLREVSSSNISKSLEGRVAGVEMTQTSSRPGSAMQIRIRGSRSLTASNDPLVVLDGIPFAGSLQDINPGDIKSVDILKDASATAIYGSRGANGVILVTTYRGETGEVKAPTVSYNGYYGVKKLLNRYPMMGAEDWLAWRQEARDNGIDYGAGDDEDTSLDTDWQDLVMKNTGVVTSHDVSIAGFTKGGGYNFGGGYYDETSLLPNQGYKRYSLRANFDQKLGQYVKVGLSSMNSYGLTNGETDGLMGTLLTLSPVINPYNADGSINEGPLSVNSQDTYYNPLMAKSIGDRRVEERKSYATYNSFYGEVKIPWVEGLKYRVNLGLNLRESNYGKFDAAETCYNQSAYSNAAVENTHMTNWAIENLLYYDKKFGKHSVGLVAMYSSEQTEYQKSRMSATDVTADALQYYNLGLLSDNGEVTIDPNNQVYYKRGLLSAMFRANYSYDNKYLATFTFRKDGSSVLADGHKWHSYPAFSLGWVMTQESFMQDLTWLNFLKLRAGYGQTSNQAVSPYETMGSLDYAKYNFGSSNVTGYYVSSLPNENLGWEFSETVNVGVDFHLLNSRLSGSFEYYTQHTKDVLVAQELPVTAGVTETFLTNAGETENKGYEISLNAKIIEDLNGFSWDLGFNLYSNKNKITKLASGQLYDKGNGWFVGQPIDVVYDFKKIGIWQSNEASEVTKYESDGEKGMIKVEYTGEYDSNGDPVRYIQSGTTLEDDDRQILGSVEPDWQGGFNTRLGYKGWDLSLIGSYKKGGILVSGIHSGASYLNLNNGRRGQIDIDYWTENNPTNAAPAPGGPSNGDNPKYVSTLAYFDASYWKISNITLAYNFKKDWLKNLHIDRLRVYATVQNPFIFGSDYYKETGLDPVPNSSSDDATTQAVVDARAEGVTDRVSVVGYSTPATRNFLFGVNLSF